MVDLFARIVAIFDTPAGMTVLGMAALAFAALFIFLFWDVIKAPRRDVISGGSHETAPPPLLAPDLVTRSDDGDRVPAGPAWLRNAVLMGLGALFVGAGFVAIGQLSEQATHRAAVRASLSPAEEVSEGAPARVVAAPENHVQVDLCEPSGSLTERFVEICANGASVRFDLMRFSREGTFVLRPTWASNRAPTFVASDSHAAPFSFDGGVEFVAPETVGAPRYDGFLVIGIGDEDMSAGVARERALRDFAVAQLSGGDRAQCATGERVFSISALFDRTRIDELEALRTEVEAQRHAARGDHQARAELAAMEQELAARQLVLIEEPGPVVIGITADPNSSDPVADMHAAAARFVTEHAEDLQIREPGALNKLRACSRGEVSL